MPLKLCTALAVLLSVSSTAAAAVNHCSDPYWKDTLRCVFFPNEIPQPNLNDVPQGQNPPAFTRVFLDANPNVRCTDGTMPLIYVDKAVGPNGQPIESNRWLISMTGGDSCNGERCAFFYAQGDERAFMGSSTKGPAKELDGIHRPDPIRNPVFAGYNRVRVEKCSFDRYMGRSQETAIHATAPNGTAITYNAYHHGFLIMQETFKALQNGLRYTPRKAAANAAAPGKRRACCSFGAASEQLPPLANAEVVLLIGHSNASHGLYHNIDHLAALLAAMPGFHGDVRALFDENFLPSVENEAAGKDLYDGVWSGTSSARGEAFSYDGAVYHATNDVDADYAAHGAVHDQSCTNAHPADAWKCRDRMHVLFNHIATPFMVRQDFTDPNREHLDAPTGHWVRWGNAANYSYCPDAQPCEPRFNAAEFRARLEKQAQTLLTSAWTRSEQAQPTTFFVWMPSCGQHEGSYENDPFYAVTISTSATSFSMRQYVEEFISAPRSGVRRYQIDGALDQAGRRMNTTQCH